MTTKSDIEKFTARLAERKQSTSKPLPEQQAKDEETRKMLEFWWEHNARLEEIIELAKIVHPEQFPQTAEEEAEEEAEFEAQRQKTFKWIDEQMEQARRQRENAERMRVEMEREQQRREALGWFGRWREDTAFKRQWNRNARANRAWHRQRHLQQCGGGFIGWCRHIRTARKEELSWFEHWIILPPVAFVVVIGGFFLIQGVPWMIGRGIAEAIGWVCRCSW